MLFDFDNLTHSTTALLFFRVADFHSTPGSVSTGRIFICLRAGLSTRIQKTSSPDLVRKAFFMFQLMDFVSFFQETEQKQKSSFRFLGSTPGFFARDVIITMTNKEDCVCAIHRL